MNKSMMLVTSTWGNKETFRLIPVTLEAPYNEGIYDPEVGVLAVIGKEKKDNLQMTPKLNQFGDPEVLKIGKRPNGKDYAEERRVIETYYEYYIENKDEIRNLVKLLALNEEFFDIEKYLKQDVPVETAPSSIITTA